MVSRCYPQGNAPGEIQSAVAQAWDLASRATRLEGEVSSHTRKLESLERRGRALQAEIGRKVEELAHEESRSIRDATGEQQEAVRLRELVQSAEKSAFAAKQAADATPSGSESALSPLYERAVAAQALFDSRREQLAEREKKASVKDQQARDLRRQIDELRAQLSRYAEALEEDLASGREKVAGANARGLGVREGVQRGLGAAPEPPQGEARSARPPARPDVGHARREPLPPEAATGPRIAQPGDLEQPSIDPHEEVLIPAVMD